MDLTEKSFAEGPKLDGIKGVMNSSGEGKWTVETASCSTSNRNVIIYALPFSGG